MLKNLGKALIAGAVAAVALIGAQPSANAAIIGSANYFGTAGDNFNPGAPSAQALHLQLDGGTIYTVADPVAAIGSPISLATVDLTAFNTLVAVLRNNIENDITLLGFSGHTIPIEVTVTDFDYSHPLGSDDLQGAGTIIDVILTINSYKTSIVEIPGFGVFSVSEYDVDIDVEAIPVPGSLIFGASGLALAGFVAVRRKRTAC